MGLVCPYALDVPGGVQNHVMGLAGHLLRSGVDVHVLAPGVADEARLRAAGLDPRRVTSAGPALPVPYNGSVARVNFGPGSGRRVRRWLAAHRLDLVHVHEPVTPSVALLALRSAAVPVVATFHTATPHSRTMRMAGTLLGGTVGRIAAGIAVSTTARRVVVQHLGRDALVIPNGFDHTAFATGRPAPARRFWTNDDRPRIAYLGRLDEPRKGLGVLLAALPALESRLGPLDVAVAGQGRATLPPGCRRLGPISDADRVALLASSDVFVAPHRERESFGLVLVEALTAGTVVVASAIPAFLDVLGAGEVPDALGFSFSPGRPDALASTVVDALASDREALARRAVGHTRRYDWSVVGPAIQEVYEAVLGQPGPRPYRLGRSEEPGKPDSSPPDVPLAPGVEVVSRLLPASRLCHASGPGSVA